VEAIDTTGTNGSDVLGNAWFAIKKDSIYYPDYDLRCKYVLRGDTIQIMQEERYVECLVIR